MEVAGLPVADECSGHCGKDTTLFVGGTSSAVSQVSKSRPFGFAQGRLWGTHLLWPGCSPRPRPPAKLASWRVSGIGRGFACRWAGYAGTEGPRRLPTDFVNLCV